MGPVRAVSRVNTPWRSSRMEAQARSETSGSGFSSTIADQRPSGLLEAVRRKEPRRGLPLADTDARANASIIASPPSRSGSSRSFVARPRLMSDRSALRTIDGSSPDVLAISSANAAFRSPSCFQTVSSAERERRSFLGDRPGPGEFAGDDGHAGLVAIVPLGPPFPGPRGHRGVEPGRAEIGDPSRQDLAFPHPLRRGKSLQLFEDDRDGRLAREPSLRVRVMAPDDPRGERLGRDRDGLFPLDRDRE